MIYPKTQCSGASLLSMALSSSCGLWPPNAWYCYRLRNVPTAHSTSQKQQRDSSSYKWMLENFTNSWRNLSAGRMCALLHTTNLLDFDYMLDGPSSHRVSLTKTSRISSSTDSPFSSWLDLSSPSLEAVDSSVSTWAVSSTYHNANCARSFLSSRRWPVCQSSQSSMDESRKRSRERLPRRQRFVD
jgi:hypothetical protein